MMAQQLGKGKGPETVPKPSKLSAAGHDGATGTVRARGTSWRRCACCWDWKEKASQAGETAEAKVWRLDMSLHTSSYSYLISMH